MIDALGSWESFAGEAETNVETVSVGDNLGDGASFDVLLVKKLIEPDGVIGISLAGCKAFLEPSSPIGDVRTTAGVFNVSLVKIVVCGDCMCCFGEAGDAFSAVGVGAFGVVKVLFSTGGFEVVGPG